MARPRPIFDRMPLRPGQLRTVADRRFADSLALRDGELIVRFWIGSHADYDRLIS